MLVAVPRVKVSGPWMQLNDSLVQIARAFCTLGIDAGRGLTL